MAQDGTPGNSREATPAQDARGALDPSDEATISSRRVDPPSYTHTRIDPDAPIHQGVDSQSPKRAALKVNQSALPPGHVLHEYALEAVLGSGGFGITYLARDNNLQCQVAIKEYLPTELAVRSSGQTVCARTDSDTHGFKTGLDSFLKETRVLAGFRHPNIVRVTRFFEANNTAYMVMDFERGKPLRGWLKEKESVDEAQLLRMFLPLLDGLDVVHKAGVLHRDIKPANIFVRESDGSLVLLDFGAARQANTGVSRSLTSIVTPGYAPFEQYHTHGAQGPWSDLYALGGVLYWVVTGEKPLEAPSRVRHDRMAKAERVAAGRYSRSLLRAIDWALAPDERNRPKCVAEFKAVLVGQAEVPRPIPEGAVVVPPHRSVGMFFAVGAVLAALVASAGYYLLTPRSGDTAVAPAPAALAVPAAPPPVGVPAVADASAPAAPARAAPAKAAAKPPVAAKRTAATQASVAPTQPAAPVAETESKPAAPPPVAYLVFDIAPGGEVVVDDRKVGKAPPLARLKVAPGKHKVEIHGSQPPYIYYYTVNLEANENKALSAKFSANPF